MEIRNFKDFGIKPPDEGFKGDKIKMSKILNRPITIHDFRIEDSKYTGKRLCMQITTDETQRIIFTGARGLLENIQEVKKENFPFITTIVEENDRFKFT